MCDHSVCVILHYTTSLDIVLCFYTSVLSQERLICLVRNVPENYDKVCTPDLLTPCSRVLLEKLISSQLVKFPTFYGAQMFITAFKSACHLSLSWATLIQSMPSHPISWRSIVILYSHLCLGLPSGFFPSSFPTKTLNTPPFSPILATCPTHFIVLYLIIWTILGEEYSS